jgi:hypothetical protein
VLTAAHCGASPYGNYDPFEFHVRIGGADYDLALSCGGDAVVDPDQPGFPTIGYWPGCRRQDPDAECDLLVCALRAPINDDPEHPELSGFTEWIPVRPAHEPGGYATQAQAWVLLGRDVLNIGSGAHLPDAADPEAWKRSDWNRTRGVDVIGRSEDPHVGLGTIQTACGTLMHGDSGGPLIKGKVYSIRFLSSMAEATLHYLTSANFTSPDAVPLFRLPAVSDATESAAGRQSVTFVAPITGWYRLRVVGKVPSVEGLEGTYPSLFTVEFAETSAAVNDYPELEEWSHIPGTASCP